MDTMSPVISPLAPREAARLFIEKIQKPACILVAISGGSDSTGLLLALRQAISDLNRNTISLQAVTVDHALRPEGADEARGVAGLCAGLGISHHIRRWDAAKPMTGISAAARLARYSLIAKVAEEINADMIVVGHTLGDQQETIAMRSARSLRNDNLGLAGMADAVLYGGRHWIMRPLLGSTRQGIRDFLREQGQSWYDDPSNDDDKYERVRMRNRQPGHEDALEDHSFRRSALSRRAARLIENHARAYHNAVIAIDGEGLAQDVAVLRHALSALSCVVGGRRFAPSADSMDSVMDGVASGNPCRSTANRVVFDRRKEGLFLYRENRNLPTTPIMAGATVVWDERFELTNATPENLVVRGCGVVSQLVLPLGDDTALPPGVALRAGQVMPILENEEDALQAFERDGLSVRPRLAPYEVFLPRFDLELANAIARLFGCPAYPPPPV